MTKKSQCTNTIVYLHPVITGEDPVMVTDVDLFSHIGWDTQETEQNELKEYRGIQNEPFIGFGSCKHTPVSNEDVQKAANVADAYKLYLQAMRTDCVPSVQKNMANVVKSDLLVLSPDKSLGISEKSALL